jgi:hypothetical protein
MRAAYRAAGPEAVAGFRRVLEAMMDPEMRRHFNALKAAGGMSFVDEAHLLVVDRRPASGAAAEVSERGGLST